MRIESYTNEDLDFAYEVMTIKYYQEPKAGEYFGRTMIQELVFYMDHILYHLSDEHEEFEPVYPCSRFWHDDIIEYEFDFDNEVLILKFLHGRSDMKIFANAVQLHEIYRIIASTDEKFVATDFDETNSLIEDFFRNLL